MLHQYLTIIQEVNMKTKTGGWIRLATLLATAAAVSIGVILNIALIPLIALPVAILIQFLIKRSEVDKIKDERLIHLAEKAARLSFSVYGIAAAGLGAFLVSYDKTDGTIHAVGMALTLSVSFLFLLYYGFYLFLTRRH